MTAAAQRLMRAAIKAQETAEARAKEGKTCCSKGTTAWVCCSRDARAWVHCSKGTRARGQLQLWDWGHHATLGQQFVVRATGTAA